eukprot:3280037-Rhodomonas_salina.1
MSLPILRGEAACFWAHLWSCVALCYCSDSSLIPHPHCPPSFSLPQHLAYCEAGVCSCPEGFWGDGYGSEGCQKHAASIQVRGGERNQGGDMKKNGGWGMEGGG